MVQNNTEKLSIKDTVIEAALKLAENQSWSDICFDEIIAQAKIDRADVLEYFDDKADILVAYGRHIDRQMIENAALENIYNVEQEQEVIRERLFDLIMERFDVLNENRSAVLSILESIKFDPKQALITFPHLGKSMGRILEEAGESLDGLKGCAKITGLTVVYLYAVKTWRDDETADMAKTMSALDKGLGFAEETANTMFNGDILGTVSNIFAGVKNKFSQKDID